VAGAEPAALGIAQRILSIPFKKTTKHIVGYLQQDELQSILDTLDLTTEMGRRDHALILFLARTGARVSEACAINAEDLKLDAPGHVLLRGKGGKDRAIPLTEDIARGLKALCEERGLTTHSQAPLFVSSGRAQRLTRWGVTHILKRAVASAAKDNPDLQTKRISPHTLRHTTAMLLLQAGVDITTIQSVMGHSSVNTTHLYAEADLEMKQRALEKCDISESPPGRFQPPDDLLDFLAGLCGAGSTHSSMIRGGYCRDST
jgi:site-specific recombinase XerD